MSYVTVIPLLNVDLNEDDHCDFGGDFVLMCLPEWILKDSMLDELDSNSRDWIRKATHGLVANYEAVSFGEPDPDWNGPEPKAIQETKREQGMLAMLSLWMSRPSPVTFVAVLHGTTSGPPVLLHMDTGPSILCHPQDAKQRLTAEDLPLAAQLHRSLVSVSQDSSVWTSAMATWQGLQMNVERIRHLLFWIALEALFGSADGREVTYRLSQRLASSAARATDLAIRSSPGPSSLLRHRQDRRRRHEHR